MKKKTYPQNQIKIKGRPTKVPRILKKHLQVIANEVTFLNHYHEIFLQFNDIVNASSVGLERSIFWDFKNWAFIGELVHRVDRICEGQWRRKDRKVNSLGAFLEDIRPYLHLFNRSNYLGVTPNTIARYKKNHPHRSDPYIPYYEFHRLNGELDKIIGKKNFSLTERQVERDAKKLKRITRKITHYRNKHLAHMAANKGKMKPPNLRELNEAIKHISKVTHKYFLLGLVGSHGLSFGNEDISKIFMRPWIDSQLERDNLKKKFKDRQNEIR